MWKLREKEVEPTVSWHKVCSAKPYTLGGKMCSLCLAEKTEIARDTSGEIVLTMDGDWSRVCVAANP